MDPASTASGTDGNATSTTFVDENINSLETDMSDSELESFVDKILGPQPSIKNSFGHSQEDKTLPTPNEIAKGNTTDKETKPVEQPDKTEEQPPEKPVPAVVEEPEEPQTPEEIPAVDTSDLFIEVTGIEVDAEGNQTDKVFRINVDDELPDDIRFRNDKQLAEVLDAMKEMRDIQSERNAEHDELVEQQEQSQQVATSNQQVIDRWNGEINDLQEAGLLEKPKADPKNGKSYTQEEIEADPALQRIDDVYRFIAGENDKRQKEGKPLLASFASAFNLFQREATQSQQAQKEKEEAEKVKRRGAMVGGGSGASSGGNGKPYVYKAGSAKSVYSVDTSDL